jgi:hypothetical protein
MRGDNEADRLKDMHSVVSSQLTGHAMRGDNEADRLKGHARAERTCTASSARTRRGPGQNKMARIKRKS